MFITFMGTIEPDDAIYIPEEIWFTRNNGKIDEISTDSFCISYIDKNHCGIFTSKTNTSFVWKGAKVTYMNKTGKIKINTRLTVKQLNNLLENDTFKITQIRLKQTKDSNINIKRIYFSGDTHEEIYYENKNQNFERIILTEQEKEERKRKALEQLHQLL